MPISAILFGGRRATAVPLVTESFDWQHGVFLGANVASEKTAAAEGKVGELRRDPFAMLPFCGYNMGDYMAPLGQGRRRTRTRPSCRRSTTSTGSARTTTGKFVWPGFGENSRVLKWIVRAAGRQGRGRRDADRRPADEGVPRHGRPRTCRRPTSTSCSRSTRRSGARRRPWSPSTSTPSVTTRRRSCGTSTARWSSVWADPSIARAEPLTGTCGLRVAVSPESGAAAGPC